MHDRKYKKTAILRALRVNPSRITALWGPKAGGFNSYTAPVADWFLSGNENLNVADNSLSINENRKQGIVFLIPLLPS